MRGKPNLKNIEKSLNRFFRIAYCEKRYKLPDWSYAGLEEAVRDVQYLKGWMAALEIKVEKVTSSNTRKPPLETDGSA